jgi:predicted dinucleotide-binding enzyme
MKIGILGSGQVATTIGHKLIQLGHQVMLGSRTQNNEKAAAWVKAAGSAASQGTFADAARFGELLWNCTSGLHSLDALREAREDNLRGKTLIDVSNPLDFSQGFPPFLSVCNTTSLAEQLQAALPETHVVKALNTVTCSVMVDPARLGPKHDIFVSGNNEDAKALVVMILKEWFGWSSVIDLGDIKSARGTEAYLLLWTRLYGHLKSGEFNIQLVRREL